MINKLLKRFLKKVANYLKNIFGNSKQPMSMDQTKEELELLDEINILK